MAKVGGYVTLTAIVREEGKQFVSHCPELDIASCGNTVEEAFENLKDAVLLYLNSLVKTKQRERVFQERGITLELEEESPFIRTYRTPVPV